MPQFVNEHEQDEFETIRADLTRRRDQKAKLIALLPEIAIDVTTAMESAGLHIPVFFTIQRGAEAIVTFIMINNPTGAEWTAACDIVCRILENRIGFRKLIARDVACVSAGTQMGVADVCINHAGSAEPNS
jgi:hypothetical protein